jgi:HAE1 family hydrophobic/amphiphilic exporter-1
MAYDNRQKIGGTQNTAPLKRDMVPAQGSEFKSSDARYLDRLTFDPALRTTWLNFFVTNFRVVILLIILITGAGIYSFIKLPRESNPEVKIPIAVISTVYPGASPTDVEELVTKKIETAVSGIKGIKKITSNSSNSFSAITVEFDAKEDLDDAIRRLKDKVSSVKNTITTDAKEPQVTEISLDDQPILTLVISGPYDGFTLRTYGERIKDELEKIQGVREVHISGGDEYEFSVAYDPAKLQFFGVSSDQGNQAIAGSNIAIPSGNFEGKSFIYPVRTDAKTFTVSDIADIPISHTDDGAVVHIGDVATVSLTATEKTTYSRISINGSEPAQSITLSIVKRTGSSVLDTVDTAKSAVEQQIASFPPGVTYGVTQDMAKLVRDDFEQLTHDFFLTLLLVSTILFLIVGLKEAFVAGIAIPLVFFVTFASLLYLGISLNFLSLFSLILALGLLVDDAIVVVSATKQYLRSGKFTPEEAVLLVLRDFKVVLTTTTLTTVWAFLPLLFATGIMGEYLKSIPITVSITLTASLLIALMINHPLAAVLERIRLTRTMLFVFEALLIGSVALLLFSGTWWGFVGGFALSLLQVMIVRWYARKGREQLIANKDLVEAEWQDEELIKKKLREQGDHENGSLGDRLIHGIIHFDRLLPLYEKYLRMVIATRKRRIVTIATTIGIFIASILLVVTGIVETEFFPASDSDYLFVDIEGPTGLRLDETDALAKQVEERLLSYPEIENFSTIVGQPSILSNQNGVSRDTSHLASLSIVLKDVSLRSIKSYDLATKIREDLRDIPGARISVETMAGGPPSGSAFEARIKGDDLQTLDRIAHDLEPMLARIPGVINISISLKDSAPEFTFHLDPVRLEQRSLTAVYVGSILRTAISGTEVSTVINNGDEIKIVARFDKQAIPTLETVQNLQILNFRKQPVFLKDVAEIELRPSVDSITRIDQKRTVLLSASVSGTTNPNQVLAEFKKRVADYALPDDYSIIYGGQNETNTESVLSVIRAMIIAMVLIVSTLIIQFNSFKKALIVLITIPLALIGVFFGMAIFGVHLSFPGLIGVLALFGIVVKNAIILVDKINLNIASGIPFFESVVDAGRSRMEAIFITSICTILGILPITLSNEMWRSLGGAIIFGLMLSSFLTLFIVPVFFVSAIGEKERFS